MNLSLERCETSTPLFQRFLGQQMLEERTFFIVVCFFRVDISHRSKVTFNRNTQFLHLSLPFLPDILIDRKFQEGSKTLPLMYK